MSAPGRSRPVAEGAESDPKQTFHPV